MNIRILLIIVLTSFNVGASEVNELDSLKNDLKLAKEDTTKVSILCEIGLYVLPSNPVESKKYALEALELAKKVKYDGGNVGAYNLLALNEEHRGNYDKAIQYYFKALRILDKGSDKENIANVYFNIGNSYNLQRDFDQAVKYLNKGLELYREIQDVNGLFYSLNTLGLMFRELDNPEKAIECHKQALEHAKSLGDERMIAGASLNLAGDLDPKENFELVIQSFNEALNAFDKLEDKKGSAISLNNLGGAYVENEMYDEGIAFLLKSIESARIIDFKDLISYNYEMINRAYADKGDYQKAYGYALLFNGLNDSLLNESKVQIIAELETKYQVEKKEQELLLHKKEIKILENDKRIKNYIFYGVIVFVVLLIISGLGWFQSYKRRKLIEENEIRHKLDAYIKEIDFLKNNKEGTTKPDGTRIVSLSNAQLSERELEVLNELSKGKTNMEISDSLFISVNTVKSHLKIIYEKLDVKNRTQAAKKIEIVAD